MMKPELTISERTNTQSTDMVLNDVDRDDDRGIAHIVRQIVVENVQCW
jgi:hypothetical protein